jgi:hypothetical protein
MRLVLAVLQRGTRTAGSSLSLFSVPDTKVEEADEARALVAETGEPTIASIRNPVLAFFGTREQGGAGELDTVRQHARAAARVDTHLIRDADHIYAGHEADVAGVLARWAATLP